jgi:tetraacyldisaccharide 4'-kinase
VSLSHRDAYLDLIRGTRRGPLAVAARCGLSLLSVGYSVGARFRNRAFDLGWRATHRVSVPVIAVGNLTLGGTGKTPMVEWVARRARREGVRVAILSRGYGQSEGLNDEGRVLEENLPDVPHLQSADRVALAMIAVEELESQLLVLDDGFQHRRLARDLDIVLLDALNPFGLGHLFPRGLLREPISSLRRADVVVLSRADLVDNARRGDIRAKAERHAGSHRWVEARHAPRDLIDSEGRSYPLIDPPSARVLAFCGIGNPEGFRCTLEGLGVRPVEFVVFADHHPYRRPDVEGLAASAARVGADLVLTTQKDLVKVRAPKLGPAPLRALRIGLDVLEGGDLLERALADVLTRCTT